MRSPLVVLALLALLPLAVAAAPAQAAAVPDPCTPPVSQFGACVGRDCVVLDGPAMHSEVCRSDLTPVVQGLPPCDPPNTPVCTYRDASGAACYAVYYGWHPVVRECLKAGALAAGGHDLPNPAEDVCVSSGTFPELRVCKTYWNGWLCVSGTYGRVQVFHHCEHFVGP